MIVIVTDKQGNEMKWELGAHGAIDKLVAALKENLPDWHEIRITIRNET